MFGLAKITSQDFLSSTFVTSLYARLIYVTYMPVDIYFFSLCNLYFLLLRHSFHVQSDLTRKSEISDYLQMFLVEALGSMGSEYTGSPSIPSQNRLWSSTDGASFGSSISDMNYASKKNFGISSLCNTMSVAAAIRMTLKDMIPWSNLSTSSGFVMLVRNAP